MSDHARSHRLGHHARRAQSGCPACPVVFLPDRPPPRAPRRSVLRQVGLVCAVTAAMVGPWAAAGVAVVLLAK